MPRSTDGRWIVACKICGVEYQQRKPDQEYCSQSCSNKAAKVRHVGPREPSVALTCPVCGNEFQAKRSDKRTCSRSCYEKLPDRVEAQRASDRRPERQARKNELRRGTQRVRDYNRKKQLERYGITVEQHHEMLVSQRGLCAICGNPPDPDGIRATSRLHTDHDHLTGRVRDLLCNNCNRGIGSFADDPVRLRAAADYIERHRTT